MNETEIDELAAPAGELSRRRRPAPRESSLPAWGISGVAFSSWTLLMIWVARDDFFHRGQFALLLRAIGNPFIAFVLLTAIYARPKNSGYKNTRWAIPIIVSAVVSMAMLYATVQWLWPEPKPGESYFMW